MIQTVTKKGVVLGLGAGGEIDDVAAAEYGLTITKFCDKIWLYYGASPVLYVSRVAASVSEDGLNYTRKGVVVGLGAGGEIDDTSSAHGEIDVVNFQEEIWCYYAAFDGGGSPYPVRTAAAVSSDGMNYVKKGVVLGLGAGGTIDADGAQGAKRLVLKNEVWCYYSAIVSTYVRKLSLATSRDGLNYVKKGVVVGLGGVGEIDDDSTSELGIAVCRHGDKIWLFSGVNDGTTSRIAAHVSSDGLNFVKKGVVVGLGGGGEIDDAHSGYNLAAISHNDKIFLYYGANDGNNTRIALAVLE